MSPQPAGAARGGRASERPRARFANFTCASHGPASAPGDPHVSRTVPAASHAHTAHSPAGPQAARHLGPASRRDLRGKPQSGAPGAPSGVAGTAGRLGAGRQDAATAGGAHPGGSALSRSEQASEAGGAICNRADATTAPYSRGAGAGGQVTAAHPTPRSRVVPAQEEPPGAL